MKKNVLLAAVLAASTGMYAQSGLSQKMGGKKLKSTVLAPQDTKQHLIPENSNTSSGTNPVNHSAPKNSGQKSGIETPKIASVSYQRFTGSRNIFTALNSTTKPLSYNSDLDLVSFVHRVSPYFTVVPNDNSGAIVVSWSLNKGVSWDSSCIYTSGTDFGRYPQGGVWNPPGNTNVNNSYFIANGPTVAGSNWTTNYFASKSYTDCVGGNNTAASGPASQNLPIAYFSNGREVWFIRNSFTTTNDGKIRMVGTLADAGWNNSYGAAILTAVFNAGQFNLSIDTLNFPVTTDGSGATNLLGIDPIMAWDNSGNVGYVIMFGDRLGATQNNQKGFQPIVYKTTNGGTTWSLIPPFAFSSFPQVYVRIFNNVNGDTSLVACFIPTYEGYDATVDANGDLHLVTTIYSASSVHPDSIGSIWLPPSNPPQSCDGSRGYYYYYGDPLGHPTIFDFVLKNSSNTWSGTDGIVVATMTSERTFTSNTCSSWSSNRLTTNARIQVSRNDAGNIIFYSWTMSDTSVNGHHFNIYPDLYMKAYNINTKKTTPNMLVIGPSTNPSDPRLQSGAFYHFMSTRAINTGGGAYEMPFTVSYDPTHGGNPATVDHFYISGAQVTNADFTINAIPLNQDPFLSVKNNEQSINIGVKTYPNPTNDFTQLVVNLDKASDIKVEITNALGQVINSMTIKGEAGQHIINVDLSNENAGVYFYSITTNVGKANGKIVKE